MASEQEQQIPYTAPLSAYSAAADQLYHALMAGDRDAQWRVKWQHPRFSGRAIADVRTALLTIDDARAVVASEYAFDRWTDLDAYVEVVSSPGAVATFERMAQAVVAGDADQLARLLRESPASVHARSVRRHRATLLHYTAANGVERARQFTPPNIVTIARLLLDAGADVNATAHMYDHECTTLSMLVSSSPPAAAGIQAALATLLLDRGASPTAGAWNDQSATMTALTFGFLETARLVAARSLSVTGLAEAAGLGWRDDVLRLLGVASATARQAALAVAAQLGHADIVRLLLGAGIDCDAHNPSGHHPHSTALHQAALAGHLDVVTALVEHGARLDICDTIYGASPLGWALHAGQAQVADYLRAHGATET